MQLIQPHLIQTQIDRFAGQELYIHLELTTGAYASHFDSTRPPGSAFISNAVIRYTVGSISGTGPYRVGLKTEKGWIYAEGLTHVDENDTERLILAGHDSQGKLIVALQLSRNPF
ncbi:YojF family protein [Paenibacillus tritici]|uniref:YojF family protein n=1 Tax=Paenibacillus tritici TaxID=1873425 RepID=A0ABX2DID9_9BACL|nr:YojF family protein [Paenibacillus tritici]NQX44270.1 YojF family protein [Paenibacillus tritici]QUL57885.1 YojF family protein [Paenibacillus tritici]